MSATEDQKEKGNAPQVDGDDAANQQQAAAGSNNEDTSQQVEQSDEGVADRDDAADIGIGQN